MIDQVKLFDLEEDEVVEESEDICEAKEDRRSFAAETLVYLYKAQDNQDNKLYFGITDNFEKRVGEHKAGKHVNRDFRKAYEDHPEAFEFSIVCSFIDMMYCSKGNNSRSHAVESLAFALYNTLNTGYNRKYMFHHDFRDQEFWCQVTPPELIQYYLIANHDMLNANVAAHIKKPMRTKIKNSGRTHDLVAKKILQQRLLELKALDIKLIKYGSTLSGINRSNLHRFLTGQFSSIGVNRTLNLIHTIEDFLGMENRFDFETAYRHAKDIK